HTARIGREPGQRPSLANLAVFNRWFILRSRRSDRLRFWRSYVAERYRLAGKCVVDYFAARDLERATWRSNGRLWRSRSRRCLGTNRRFQRIAAPGVTGHAVIDWQPAELETLVSDLDRLFDPANGPILKDSPSSTVALRELTIIG